jgi:hypothetical protein
MTISRRLTAYAWPKPSTNVKRAVDETRLCGWPAVRSNVRERLLQCPGFPASCRSFRTASLKSRGGRIERLHPTEVRWSGQAARLARDLGEVRLFSTADLDCSGSGSFKMVLGARFRFDFGVRAIGRLQAGGNSVNHSHVS